MNRLLKYFPASLRLALGVVVLLMLGGVISLSAQGWQSKKEGKAAAFEMTGGDADRGKMVISRANCGACHEIPGVKRADGTVGPPLDKIAKRAFIAGRLSNTPANLMQWVQHPQEIEPGSGMPNPPISDQEARDVVAYLYTLK